MPANQPPDHSADEPTEEQITAAICDAGASSFEWNTLTFDPGSGTETHVPTIFTKRFVKRILDLRPEAQAAPKLTEGQGMDDDHSDEALVQWLRNKYARHGEIEDKLAAGRLSALASLHAQAAKGVSGDAAADEVMECFGYQRLFDAIAAATRPEMEGSAIGISVSRFLETLRATDIGGGHTAASTQEQNNPNAVSQDSPR